MKTKLYVRFSIFVENEKKLKYTDLLISAKVTLMLILCETRETLKNKTTGNRNTFLWEKIKKSTF